MFTTSDILDLVTSTSDLARGKAELMRKELVRHKPGASPEEVGARQRQRDFVNELLAARDFYRQPESSYKHPFRVPAPPVRRGKAELVRDENGKTRVVLPTKLNGALSESDRVWLERLPRNPADVIYDDAATLAGLLKGFDAGRNPSDARLLEAVAAPIRRLHDRRAAEAEASAARQPLAEIPAGLAAAVAATAEAEHAGVLTADECWARGSAALRGALDARSAAREAAIRAADAKVAELKAVEARAQQTVVAQ